MYTYTRRGHKWPGGVPAPTEGYNVPMSVQNSSTEKTRVQERIESFTAYGKPHCDVCYNLDPEDRPDEAEFWPSPAIHYVRGDESCAHQFLGVTLCEHHDLPQFRPEDATHRAVDEPEYVGDNHRMNSAYKHNVTVTEEL